MQIDDIYIARKKKEKKKDIIKNFVENTKE